METQKNIYRALMLSLLALSAACSSSGNEEPSPNEPKYLVSYDNPVRYDAGLLQLAANLGGAGSLAGNLQYSIRVYKTTYRTQYQGQEILASGLVCIPLDTPAPPPLLGAFRGTIFSHGEAPTKATTPSFELLASTGYVTFIPDMIGFGSSEGIKHPYYDEGYSASAALDMIRAGQELLALEEVAFRPALYLFGYSQGGYIAVATHKALEEGQDVGATLVGTAAGAGSYDITGTMDHVLTQQNYGSPAYLANVLYTYNGLYGWGHPMTRYFQEPYAGQIAGLLNGSRSMGQINSALTTEVAALFQPAFIEALRNKTETQVLGAFSENSLYEWGPQKPVLLFHSTEDQYIPAENTVFTHARMMANGARSVELVTRPAGLHVEAVFDMLGLTVSWFSQQQ